MKFNNKLSLKNGLFPKNNKGLSAVITTLILIALVISAIAIVWMAVTNLLTDRFNSAENCINIFEKVKIEGRYTCYDSPNFQFSISIKDIDVEGVVVTISGAGETKSYTINNTATRVENLANYPLGTFGIDLIKLPGKNSGLTYLTDEFSEIPDSIQVAPVIRGTQCEASDSILKLSSC